MTIALALEYIPRRMEELGHGKNYHLRFRHFVLQANESIEINACGHVFVLVEEVEDVKVESDFGLYDTVQNNGNEQNYEHQGIMHISNNANRINHLRFIQVIPKRNTEK
ncbi:MAG: hypothetical protein KF900_09410 [Bacteroidetes bacterium]|nr:hypothetical protein [Bacteroidota bacterium]